MKITVEVTKAEVEEMNATDAADLEQMLRHQLDEGVSGNAGENGEDWMVEYDLEVIIV